MYCSWTTLIVSEVRYSECYASDPAAVWIWLQSGTAALTALALTRKVIIWTENTPAFLIWRPDAGDTSTIDGRGWYESFDGGLTSSSWRLSLRHWRFCRSWVDQARSLIEPDRRKCRRYKNCSAGWFRKLTWTHPCIHTPRESTWYKLFSKVFEYGAAAA